MFVKMLLYIQTVGVRGLLRAAVSKLIGRRYLWQVMHAGCSHPFWLRLPSSDVPTYKQVFVDKEYDFSASQPPAVIIDAGANIGLASIWFANRFPNSMILAVEPERSNFELLKKNVAVYPNVTPIHAALWLSEEKVRLSDSGLGNWGFRTEGIEGTEKRSVESECLVNSVTVESLMKVYGLERVSILKIDIEGAEKEVFSESANWIGFVDSIIIELHDRFKEGCSESFYAAIAGFSEPWRIGENIFVSRNDFLRKPTVDG
jgi:FkbM family methyltransferase